MESEKDNNTESGIQKAAEDLFNYAVERENLKALMQFLPEEAAVERNKVEYELMILKIVSVGWGISFYLEGSAYKEALIKSFWDSIHEFSKSISETTGLMIGKDIDYFNVLRERLDYYLAAMLKQTDAPEPAVVIGPEFAKVCGNLDDTFTVMTGARMFKLTINGVKKYLDELGLQQIH